MSPTLCVLGRCVITVLYFTCERKACKGKTKNLIALIVRLIGSKNAVKTHTTLSIKIQHFYYKVESTVTIKNIDIKIKIRYSCNLKIPAVYTLQKYPIRHKMSKMWKKP